MIRGRSFLNVNKIRCQLPALHKQLRECQSRRLLPYCWDEALNNNLLMIAMFWTLHWRIFLALHNCRLCPDVWTLHPVFSTLPRLILWLASTLSKPGQEQLKNEQVTKHSCMRGSKCTSQMYHSHQLSRCSHLQRMDYRHSCYFCWNLWCVCPQTMWRTPKTFCGSLGNSNAWSKWKCQCPWSCNSNWPCIQVFLSQLESDPYLPQRTGLRGMKSVPLPACAWMPHT